ncbi:amidase domain-containing protein [Acidaminococcus massiliensis]
MATLNRSKVLEYVDKYWNRRNNQFFDYGESDCTNFVSQCWNYAGISR